MNTFKKFKYSKHTIYASSRLWILTFSIVILHPSRGFIRARPSDNICSYNITRKDFIDFIKQL